MERRQTGRELKAGVIQNPTSRCGRTGREQFDLRRFFFFFTTLATFWFCKCIWILKYVLMLGSHFFKLDRAKIRPKYV